MEEGRNVTLPDPSHQPSLLGQNGPHEAFAPPRFWLTTSLGISRDAPVQAGPHSAVWCSIGDEDGEKVGSGPRGRSDGGHAGTQTLPRRRKPWEELWLWLVRISRSRRGAPRREDRPRESEVTQTVMRRG